MNTLTKDDVTTLTRHFLPGEHEFVRGFTYITEQAITTRLDEVDPAWTLTILDTHQRNEQIVVTARLTIKGVSRDGVGMQKIERKETTDEKTGEIKPFESGEPEKGAATDALKRAARLFGIGRYLLDTPGRVKTVDHIATWLKQQNTNGTHPTPPTQPTPETSQNGSNGSDHTPAKNTQGQANITWPSKEALETVLTHMQRATGVIDMSMTEFARLAGIEKPELVGAWDHFESGKAVYEVAMKQFEAEQKPAKPAAPKPWVFNRDMLLVNGEVITLYPQKNHREKMVDLLRGSGLFNDCTVYTEAVERVKTYHRLRNVENLEQAAAIKQMKDFAEAF